LAEFGEPSRFFLKKGWFPKNLASFLVEFGGRFPYLFWKLEELEFGQYHFWEKGSELRRFRIGFSFLPGWVWTHFLEALLSSYLE